MNTIINDQRFLSQLKRHEGFRPRVYLCTAGHRTIGYGHNLDSCPVAGIQDGDVISRSLADEILWQDLAPLERRLSRCIPHWNDITAARRAVLVNMAFNMGVDGLLKFRRMLGAVENSDWQRAADEMLESEWVKQVKGRAFELARQMQTGEWQEGQA